MQKFIFLSVILVEVFLYVKVYKKPFPWKHGFAGVFIFLVASYGSIYLFKPITSDVYMLIYEKLRIFNFEKISGFWQATLLVFVYEFVYYWNHRLRHSVRLFWLEHSVHHNVSHINYMTGLQASWMSFFTGAWMIWAILYLIGFNPIDIAMMIWYGSFYRFLLHTELVPKLGWLEYIFNTPSNHRVHHGINDIYKRKNYGSSFVLFDIMFGTYQQEVKDEVIVYGTGSMTKSLNPFAIVYNEWVRYYRDLKVKFAIRL